MKHKLVVLLEKAKRETELATDPKEMTAPETYTTEVLSALVAQGSAQVLQLY